MVSAESSPYFSSFKVEKLANSSFRITFKHKGNKNFIGPYLLPSLNDEQLHALYDAVSNEKERRSDPYEILVGDKVAEKGSGIG